MARIVEIFPYDYNWVKDFIAERDILKDYLGDNCIAIHHIGSTSVPGLSAKPLIDIMIEVKDLAVINTSMLEQIGYTNRGELGMPFRVYMHKGKLQHTHHLHIWQQGNPEIEKHLLFRDYLISNADEKKQYMNLKIDLAKDYRNDHHKYTALKDQFIKNILQKAGYNGLTIVQILHEREVSEYHRIRKSEIFDRLPNIIYDPNHPTMSDPNHFHFVLMLGVVVIGICQVEILDNATVILRMLAIDSSYQKQGYGDYLLGKMELWISSKGKTKILLHAATSAEYFYKNRGYTNMEFEDEGINQDTVDLGKIL